MTLRDALAEGARLLGASGSESPALDASLLLSAALGLDRPSLLARLPEPVPGDVSERYRALLSRRAAGEPVAYVLGRREFWGRDFLVDARVLVPRPETEHLVETARDAVRGLLDGCGGSGWPPSPVRLHDACTGSGCVGISLYLELRAHGDAETLLMSFSDKSLPALDVARENARRLIGQEAEGFAFIHSDFLEGVDGPFDLITANPPYLTDNEMDEARSRGNREPELALSGGADGLEPYRRLAAQAWARLADGGWLVVEIGWKQADEVTALFRRAGYESVLARPDLAGRDRVVAGRKRCRSS